MPDLFDGLHGRDVRIRVLEVGGRKPKTEPEKANPARPSHGPNFETVTWDGRMYPLTTQQRIIIAVLWRAWEDGNPFVAGAYLLERADSNQSKMSAVFRKSPAWGKLIVKGELHGGPVDSYCLAPLMGPAG